MANTNQTTKVRHRLPKNLELIKIEDKDGQFVLAVQPVLGKIRFLTHRDRIKRNGLKEMVEALFFLRRKYGFVTLTQIGPMGLVIKLRWINAGLSQ